MSYSLQEKVTKSDVNYEKKFFLEPNIYLLHIMPRCPIKGHSGSFKEKNTVIRKLKGNIWIIYIRNIVKK